MCATAIYIMPMPVLINPPTPTHHHALMEHSKKRKEKEKRKSIIFFLLKLSYFVLLPTPSRHHLLPHFPLVSHIMPTFCTFPIYFLFLLPLVCVGERNFGMLLFSFRKLHHLCQVVSLTLFWGLCCVVTLLINNFTISVTSWHFAFTPCAY